MRITSVNHTNSPVNFHNPRRKSSTPAFSQRQVISKGLGTFCGWFGFGVVLDALTRHIKLSNSPIKNSVAVNGLIALCAGAVSSIALLYKKEK